MTKQVNSAEPVAELLDDSNGAFLPCFLVVMY